MTGRGVSIAGINNIIAFTISILLVLSNNICFAQSDISIYRASFDQIIIKNNLNHSITLQVGNDSKVVIPTYGLVQGKFKLNYSNVTSTSFRVTYDYDSFLKDSILCEDTSELEKSKFEGRKNRLLVIMFLFQNSNLSDLIAAIHGLYCSFLMSSECEEMIKQITLSFNSSDPVDQKIARMNGYFTQVDPLVSR